MPVLKWSERAWRATTEQQRMHLKKLFDALIRNQAKVVEQLPDVLQLDLPGEENPYHRFVAEKRGDAWHVDAKIVRPDLKIRFLRNTRL